MTIQSLRKKRNTYGLGFTF